MIHRCDFCHSCLNDLFTHAITAGRREGLCLLLHGQHEPEALFAAQEDGFDFVSREAVLEQVG